MNDNREDLVLRIPEETLSKFYIEIGTEVFEIPVYRLNAPRAFAIDSIEKRMLVLQQDLKEGAVKDPVEALRNMYALLHEMMRVMIPGFEKYENVFSRLDFNENIIAALFEKIAIAALDRPDAADIVKKNMTRERKTRESKSNSGPRGSRRKK